MNKMPKERKRLGQNPILDRIDQDGKQSRAYHASPKLEKKTAKRVGGYVTTGSGNKREKGDIRKRGVTRIEHKATQHASFRVTLEMLEKIELAARGCDEIPILVVEFLDDRGHSIEKEIAVLPWSDLLNLLDGTS